MNQTVLTFLALLAFPGVITERYGTIFPTEPIKAEEGSNVTLQCHLDPSVNVVDYTSYWYRADLYRLVHVYPHKYDDPGPQLDPYRGRTTLDHDDLSRGVLTLQISSVQLSDSGPYRCVVRRLMAVCTINLSVGKRETPSTTRPPLDPVTEPDDPEVREEEEEEEEEEKKKEEEEEEKEEEEEEKKKEEEEEQKEEQEEQEEEQRPAEDRFSNTV